MNRSYPFFIKVIFLLFILNPLLTAESKWKKFFSFKKSNNTSNLAQESQEKGKTEAEEEKDKGVLEPKNIIVDNDKVISDTDPIKSKIAAGNKETVNASSQKGEESKDPKVVNNPFVNNDNFIYRIGEGDSIAINVWNQPELSGSFTVGPDGRFTLPLIGEIRITNLTRTQATDLIKNKLEKFYPGVTVQVGVERYTSNQITILGNINTPGVVYFEKKPKLLDVIARSGGLSDQGIKKIGGCTIMRGKGNLAWVDLDALLNGGNLSLNLSLNKNDIVYIPKWEDQLYYVLGEVNGPGQFPWKKELNLLNALQIAGSYTADANLSKIQLIRRSKDKIIVYNLKKLLKLNVNEIPMLEEGDIVFVPPNWMSKVSYVISRLNPFSWYFFTTGRATIPGVTPGVDQIAR